MSRELRQRYTRNLRQQYVVIEEAARVLRDIIEVLPERRVYALFSLPGPDEEEPAVEELRSRARAAILGELLEFLDSKLNPEPRPRLVRPGERVPPLQLTYRQFEAVLREWDVYTFLEMKRMSRGIPSATSALRLASGDYDPEAAETADLKLSDLAGFLWRSLEAGLGAAERIHDGYYAEEQARHFEEMYQSPERVAGILRNEYGWLPPPEEMFLKLGQPAQLIVVRDGMLQRAVDNYGRGVGLKREREEAARRRRNASPMRGAKSTRLSGECANWTSPSACSAARSWLVTWATCASPGARTRCWREATARPTRQNSTPTTWCCVVGPARLSWARLKARAWRPPSVDFRSTT
jgi:hypothetical protein